MRNAEALRAKYHSVMRLMQAVAEKRYPTRSKRVRLGRMRRLTYRFQPGSRLEARCRACIELQRTKSMSKIGKCFPAIDVVSQLSTVAAHTSATCEACVRFAGS
jgi:hypothetical protein